MIFAILFVAAPLEICAASSFTDVLPTLAMEAAKLRTHDAAKLPADAPAKLRFDSSSKLAKLVEAGAPCDVVLLADDVWAKWLADKKLVRTPVVFASNRLVAIVPKDAPPLTAPAELAKAERLALAGENVPAGRYARAALAHHAVVAKKIVRADNVRTVLAWVARGEANAGIVYATDARVEPKVRVAFVFGPEAHPKIQLTAAALSDAGGSFVAFLESQAARHILIDAGFLDP